MSTDLVSSSGAPALNLGEVPAAPVRRPRTLMIGTVLAAAASTAGFVALVAIYVSMRSQDLADGGHWLADFHVPLTPANMGMATLSMSVVTMQWAVYAARRADRPHTYLALGVTGLLGVAFVNSTAFFLTQSGLAVNGEDATPAATLVLTIVGLHLAMVAAALIYIALMGVRSLGGQFTGNDAEGISAAAVYWYAAVAVYSILWYAIYITK